MAFLGMRGNGDWVTDQRPKNYRETILRLYPNGDAPLTAILSMMGSEKVDDPEFNWWTKGLAGQAAAVTGVYTDPALSSAYVSGGVIGSIVYLKMAAAVAAEFRKGHQVLMRDESDLTVDVVGKVLDVQVNGASSYIAVKLLEADDNSSLGDLSDCDRVLIIGNINPEGGEMPTSIAYDPVKWYNYTQIFRTPLSITRTARRTRLRTGDAYKEAKREALELHSIEMEMAFLFGIKTETTGANGKPERTTLGLIPAIKTGAAANCSYYPTSTEGTGKTWVTAGETWMNNKLEQIFRYGSQEKLALCGNGVLLGIQSLIRAGADMTFQPGVKVDYGLVVGKWVTTFGTIYLKTHPKFNMEASLRHAAVITEPRLLKYRFIDDTDFYAQPEKHNEGRGRIDGTEEEYLTEAGLEYHHPSAMGYLTGFGIDG